MISFGRLMRGPDQAVRFPLASEANTPKTHRIAKMPKLIRVLVTNCGWFPGIIMAFPIKR